MQRQKDTSVFSLHKLHHHTKAVHVVLMSRASSNWLMCQKPNVPCEAVCMCPFTNVWRSSSVHRSLLHSSCDPELYSCTHMSIFALPRTLCSSLCVCVPAHLVCNNRLPRCAKFLFTTVIVSTVLLSLFTSSSVFSCHSPPLCCSIIKAPVTDKWK